MVIIIPLDLFREFCNIHQLGLTIIYSILKSHLLEVVSSLFLLVS